MKKNTIEGIEVLLEEADHYLQINDIGAEGIRKIWKQIETDYPQYDKWLCYHNTQAPLSSLEKIGAALVDDCVEMRLAARAFRHKGTPDVARVTEDDFCDFAAYHDERNPQIYWTSERIGRGLSRWGIFVMRADGRITGYILLSMWDTDESEIFAIDAPDSAQYEALIQRAATFAFDSGKKEVLFMADAGCAAQEAASRAGFAVTGFYKGYRIKRA